MGQVAGPAQAAKAALVEQVALVVGQVHQAKAEQVVGLVLLVILEWHLAGHIQIQAHYRLT